MGEQTTGTVTFLFTDVVGSSALWDADHGAMARAMEQHDRLTTEAISAHGGTVVKHTGDGVFAAFDSALRAVDAAWALDRAIAAGDWSPLPSFAIRIGLHTGEAEHRNGDFFGSAVGRAARVMGHAGPGEILMSGTTADLVRRRLPGLTLVDLGDRELRGFSTPVRLVRVVEEMHEVAVSPSIDHSQRATWIAVLPFRALSGDDWLAEAFTDEVIGGLGKWRSLRVIGRTSVSGFTDPDMTVPQVAAELGVRVVLEGSVRTSGDRFRVTARLLDGRDGAQVWSDRYDGELEDAFDVQDRIVLSIVGAIDPAVRAFEGSATIGRRVEDLSAWEVVQRSWMEIYRYRPESFSAATSMLEGLIASGVESSEVWAALSFARGWTAWLRMGDDLAAIAEAAVRAAREAIRMDAYNPTAHAAAGWAAYGVGDMEATRRHSFRAIELNPSMGFAYAVAAVGTAHGGDPASAILLIDRGIELTPRDPSINWYHGARAVANFMLGNLEEVVVDAGRALAVRSGYLFARVCLTAALVELAEMDRARREMRAILDLDPSFSMAYLDPYTLSERDRERFRRALAAAGLGSEDPADG